MQLATKDIPGSPRNDYRGKRVLVTGGLGFIGSNLALRLLDLGAEVLLVDALVPETGANYFNIDPIRDHARLSIRKTDIRDVLTMERLVADQDFIFNLAGQVSHIDSMTDPFTDLEINCRSQLALLEACRHHAPNVKVLFSSTRQVYGRVEADQLPAKEDRPPDPVDINGINKLAGERYHILYNRVYGLRTSVLRLTNTYGPRMLVKNNRQTFVGWFVRQVIDGEEIRLFGDGSQLRDLTYVDDVVEAFLAAGANEASNGQIFNVGGIRPYSLREITEALIEVAGSGEYRLMPFPPDRKVIDIGSVYVDDSKLRAALGWSPAVDLREGLARTVAFCREHSDQYWESPGRAATDLVTAAGDPSLANSSGLLTSLR